MFQAAWLRSGETSGALGLDLGQEPLDAAINAVDQSPHSHGFHAFFKLDASRRLVMDMLKKVKTMKAIRGLKPNRFLASQPEFVCVDENTQGRYPRLPTDPYQTCRFMAVFGLWMRGFKYIFICPKFFNLPIAPSVRHCPRVIDNEFERKGYLLADYQKYILIHEMIHFYLGQSSLGWESKPVERYKLNECVNFDAKNSLRNPMNYQYYVASKSICAQV
ncbi:MAG: hypothetical protein Q9228_002572 [Teloschistes exilis]